MFAWYRLTQYLTMGSSLLATRTHTPFWRWAHPLAVLFTIALVSIVLFTFLTLHFFGVLSIQPTGVCQSLSDPLQMCLHTRQTRASTQFPCPHPE